jgi:hypothetical protein
LVGSTGVVKPGSITVASRNGNRNGVFVRVLDTAGAPEDTGFHLIVYCFNA